jgi:hypothetical protein
VAIGDSEFKYRLVWVTAPNRPRAMSEI